jgi:hypothetical protein
VSNLQPVSAGLKFGFIAVLYLFLAWVARSAMRDLRSGRGGPPAPPSPEETGMYAASVAGPLVSIGEARLVVERAPGHEPGMIYDIGEGAVLGRGAEAEIRLEDPFASSRHAQLLRQGGLIVLEDLGSTNGTYLNEEPLQGPAPLHAGDRLRIGDSEFTFETG